MAPLDEDKKSVWLAEHTKTKIELYERMRRAGVESSGAPFWDIILLTATDEDQAESYRVQLQKKQDKHEIPVAEYKVVADPVGTKIGNGGATMHALEFLEAEYGSKLDNLKVMIIHAGGYSKRLPHVSVVGKIFATLPLGDPVYQMLEMKIASYIEFPGRMSPGVFVTCADTVELFDSTGDLSFHAKGFTALGHPSSLEIGTTHGVFVLNDNSRQAAADVLNGKIERDPCTSALCDRFLHKPSKDVMKAAGAIIPGTEEVYTDSAYYFDRDTSKSLLEFYKENKPLTCEVDAYGDFLQGLGPKATDEYTRDAANVISAETTLEETRLKLYNHLKGTPLNVLLCDISKFYHIGTVPEYLHHYTSDEMFRAELQLESGVKIAGMKKMPDGTCGMHSSIHPSATLGSNSVFEFCSIGENCSVGEGCILSGASLPAGTSVPKGLFLHTTCVKDGFVSLVFGTCESLKTGASVAESGEKLTYCEVKLSDALNRLACDATSLWNPEVTKRTLWNCKMFPVFPTAEESAINALNIAKRVKGLEGEDPKFNAVKRLEMADILKQKDLSRVVETRERVL